MRYVKEKDVETESAQMKIVPYKNAVGSMIYSMVSTRMEIAYGMGLVSRFMSKPSREHSQTVKWLLRYLKGKTNLKFVYSANTWISCEVVGYCDSDYAADLDKRRSLSGYVFTVGENVVSWKSSLQHVVAL
ncbi:secreted RxLR effector protein 161-like [Henckelia pumila]|uniref:secreted RxLR effector protein 161-like n=1 Tax=Henckelia pumila TaxID=405737 RepID=UPI003C6DCCC4